MNSIDLYESLNAIDEDVLERSEKPVKKRSPWVKWVGLAACLCLVIAAAFAVPGLTDSGAGPAGSTEDIPQPGGTPADADIPGADPGLSDSVQEDIQPAWRDELTFNEVQAPLADTAPAAGVAIFGEALTQDELQSVQPDILLEWMELSGSALYYGYGPLAMVYLEFYNASWGDKITCTIRDAETPVYSDIVIEPDTVETSEINGLIVTAYRYFDPDGGVMLWAEFEREGLTYSLAANVDADNLEHAQAYLTDVVYCYANTVSVPDLGFFSMRGTHEYLNEALTLQKALEEETFGAYMLSSPPVGFSEGSFHRYQDQYSNYLSGLWTKGYDELRWKVSYFEEDDAARVTAAQDTENYDLSLYPIPMAESVPEELREIVDNPIFPIEELTQEAVYKRAYTVNDAGDTDGYRMRFGVLYGDILVEISSKSVSPQWIYEQLTALE